MTACNLVAPLVQQLHLSQERLVTRVGFEIPQERVAFNSVEHYIFLAIRSVKPSESPANFATICVNFRDPVRPASCIRLRGARECRILLGIAFHRVVYEGEARISAVVRSRLLHLRECRV